MTTVPAPEPFVQFPEPPRLNLSSLWASDEEIEAADKAFMDYHNTSIALAKQHAVQRREWLKFLKSRGVKTETKNGDVMAWIDSMLREMGGHAYRSSSYVSVSFAPGSEGFFLLSPNTTVRAEMDKRRAEHAKKQAEIEAARVPESVKIAEIARTNIWCIKGAAIDMPYTGGDLKEYVETVKEAILDRAVEAFIEEHDDEIEISCCNHCNTWTIGDKYCSCGETRVFLYRGFDRNNEVVIYDERA